MLPTTTSVDPRLADVVDGLEAGQPGLRVLAAGVYRLPYARLRARAVLQAPRRFNILEEFILRAAAELEPAPTPAELAALLGLDQLFVDAALVELAALKAVARGPAISLTAAGRQFHKKGQALQAAEHRPLTLVYRPVVDELQIWREASPVDAPALPGLPSADRQELPARAAASVTAARVIAAAEAAGLRLHQPNEGSLLSAVDEVALDDLGWYGCAVLVVQDTLAAAGVDDLSLLAVDLERQAQDAGLQSQLDAWLKVGQVKITDFLRALAEADAPAAAESLPEEAADYAQLFRQQAPGVELLRASNTADRSRQLLRQANHSVLFLLPRLSAEASSDAALRDMRALAARGVTSLVGWGLADEPGQEPDDPPADVLDVLESLLTPDGLPAAPVWWVGGQVGQDVVFDQAAMLSTVPNAATRLGRRLAAGASTYLVSAPDLVQGALEDIEPSFARAARQAWRDAARPGGWSRDVLERCCVTWAAIRRPGEAFSHLVKLAAGGAEAMPLAWQLLTVTCLALARQPAADLEDMGAVEALRRAAPEFLDWADSAGPSGAGLGPAAAGFAAVAHQLLSDFSADPQASAANLLAGMAGAWQAAAPPADAPPADGRSTLQIFAPPADEKKTERPKKRRY